MSHPEALDAYLAAWNERDPSRVRGHLDQALAEDVVFVDPRYKVSGRAAVERMVRRLQKRIPNLRTEIASGFDHHHDLWRYEWRVLAGDRLVSEGMDVTRVNAQGQIERIDGFFGPVPPKA